MKHAADSVDALIADRLSEEVQETIQEYIARRGDAKAVERVAANAFLSLTRIWRLSRHEAEDLLNITTKEFNAWQDDDVQNLTAESLEKISCLVGMYKHLGTLYSEHSLRTGACMSRENTDYPYYGKTHFQFLSRSSIEYFYVVLRQLIAATV